MPLTLMLLALVFRGVAFEFRFKVSPEGRWAWDFAFFGGSLIATLCQGIALGAFIQGIEVEGRAYGGGWFDWLTPFSVLTGVSLIGGYALLGATWLIMKGSGSLQDRAFRLAGPIGVLVVAAVVAVSIATALLDPDIARRWFSWPNCFRCGAGVHLVAITGQAARSFAVPDRLGSFRAVLFGTRDQPLSLRRAADGHDLAGRFSRQHAEFSSRRCRNPLARHHRLYGVCLLGFPRQGRQERISRVRRDYRRRLAWFAALWVGGVAALAIVSLALRTIAGAM
jgi:hypothetical protein